MNFNLIHIPERTEKVRSKGITMVMDKGLSLNEAKNLVSACGHLIDFVKLGFGTSAISNDVRNKIQVYRDANIKTYLGGTLFEAFIIRDQLADYCELIEKWELDTVEISDGSILMDHEKKCDYISSFAKKFTVLSEVGCKDAKVSLDDTQWIHMMKKEIQSGSNFVIAEARESGNVGIYNSDGGANNQLISHLIQEIEAEKILWEAPHKPQQVWFIKQLGANVNLGNISPNEVIALETLRLGLRGDTFFDFLPIELKKFKIPQNI